MTVESIIFQARLKKEAECNMLRYSAALDILTTTLGCVCIQFGSELGLPPRTKCQSVGLCMQNFYFASCHVSFDHDNSRVCVTSIVLSFTNAECTLLEMQVRDKGKLRVEWCGLVQNKYYALSIANAGFIEVCQCV